MARHCVRVRCHDWPSIRATPTPINPETKYRADRASSGEASATMIRAEVKADDHISAKASPMRIALMSIPGPFAAPVVLP